MVAGSPSVPSPWPTPLYCAIRPQTRDARALVEQEQHRLPDRAADILEVHVDPVGTRRRQVGWKIGGTVIDCGVEAQVGLHERTFLRAAGNADGPRAARVGRPATRRVRSPRRADPILSQEAFSTDAEVHWCSPHGGVPAWTDPHEQRVACQLHEDAHHGLYLMCNASTEAVDF